MHRVVMRLVVAGVMSAWSVAALAQGLPPAEAGSPGETPALETNPAVRAALELPRTEPAHYFAAVMALVDLNRPELAAPILKELIDQNLSDAQKSMLVGKFGSHRMLQLSRTTALAPAGAEFAESCMAAAANQARDPQRMAALVKQLSAASPDVRKKALLMLDGAGEAGVVAALEALAEERDPQKRRAIVEAVVQMGPEAVGPLLAMLANGNPALRVEAIRMLDVMQVMQAAPLIAAETRSGEAVPLLTDALDRYRRGTPAFVADENDEVTLWYWEDASRKLGSVRVPAADAQTIWMARLAWTLAKQRPDIHDFQRQALVLGLDAGTGWTERVSVRTARIPQDQAQFNELLQTADAKLLSEALADAMKQNRPRAAIRLAQLLGARGDVGAAHTGGPKPAPLAGALEFPDRRVRFAALEAIMKLDPPSPFPGDSRVAQALGYFATGANERRAVVAMPVSGQASTLAGRLAGMGIEAEPATRGAPAVRLAQGTADLEFILVDIDIDGPGIRDVLYALRTDAATGRIPIGLLATGARWDAAQRLAGEHTRVVAFPRPQSDAALAELVERLMTISGRDPIAPEERAAMAVKAMGWIGQLLARGETFYDLHDQAPVIEAAIYLPEMTESSIAALTVLGTPSSQRALVDFASHRELPLDARQRAVAALQQSVAANGVLLTEEEILRQYNRYNASETADAGTQQVLGAVLDVLETRQPAATGFSEEDSVVPMIPHGARGSAGASPFEDDLPAPQESTLSF